MKAGRKFSSFEELRSAIANYERTVYAEFWISKSRTVHAARKKGITRPIDENLTYYSLTYSCKHGGRTHKSVSTGARPKQTTYKINCPAHISFLATKDGKCLEVIEVVDQHTHTLSEKCFQHLPRQRRLNEEETGEAKKLLALKANKKCIQGHFFNGGKRILLRDLHNLTTKMQAEKVKGSTLDFIASRVQESGGTMDMLVDGDDVLIGLFYQDSDMKKAYENFPEIVFVDAIHKTNDKRMPLGLFDFRSSGSPLAARWQPVSSGSDRKSHGLGPQDNPNLPEVCKIERRYSWPNVNMLPAWQRPSRPARARRSRPIYASPA
ncbi:uncharacterized protein LOC142588445 [Dermacentor variabilis]|uniref:uncharacterized protein LOC142588445 n=1 Tax=Dermacentor variabilis TaxID=34621 RepID=UPI003F5B3C75